MIKSLMLAALLAMSATAVAGDKEPTVLGHSHNADGTLTFLLADTGEPCPQGSSYAIKTQEQADGSQKPVDGGCWAYNQQEQKVVILWLNAEQIEEKAPNEFYKGSSDN